MDEINTTDLIRFPDFVAIPGICSPQFIFLLLSPSWTPSPGWKGQESGRWLTETWTNTFVTAVNFTQLSFPPFDHQCTVATAAARFLFGMSGSAIVGISLITCKFQKCPLITNVHLVFYGKTIFLVLYTGLHKMVIVTMLHVMLPTGGKSCFRY